MAKNPQTVDLSKHKPLMDCPYPRILFENIKAGKPVSFSELINTGMVVSFLVFNEDDLRKKYEEVKIWAGKYADGFIFVDLDEEQKELDRLLEIHKNNGSIDHEGFLILFAKICVYSSQLSEHIEDSTLVTVNHLELTFGNGSKAWYFAMSSHPDLFTESKLGQYCDDGLARLHKILRVSSRPTKKYRPRNNFSEKQKKIARDRQNGKCNRCSEHPARWEYNHKDGDRSNNSDENCEALCPTCHSVITYDESE